MNNGCDAKNELGNITQKKEKHSDILAVVHETAKSLYDSGLMNIATMHIFDVMCRMDEDG